jgi:hypothetical protein
MINLDKYELNGLNYIVAIEEDEYDPSADLFHGTIIKVGQGSPQTSHYFNTATDEMSKEAKIILPKYKLGINVVLATIGWSKFHFRQDGFVHCITNESQILMASNGGLF